jgi:hypothetical protein
VWLRGFVAATLAASSIGTLGNAIGLLAHIAMQKVDKSIMAPKSC